MSMETLNWMGNKGHACIAYIISIPCIEVMKKKRNNRKKTIPKKKNMYINTTVTPVSFFFFSQAYWLLAPITNTGRTITFHMEKTGLGKRESCQLLYIPLPLLLFLSQQLKQPCTLQSTSDTSLGRLWIK